MDLETTVAYLQVNWESNFRLWLTAEMEPPSMPFTRRWHSSAKGNTKIWLGGAK